MLTNFDATGQIPVLVVGTELMWELPAPLHPQQNLPSLAIKQGVLVLIRYIFVTWGDLEITAFIFLILLSLFFPLAFLLDFLGVALL